MAANDPRTAAGTRRIGLVQRRCEPDPDRNLSDARDAIANEIFVFAVNREGHETQGGARARAFDSGADPC